MNFKEWLKEGFLDKVGFTTLGASLTALAALIYAKQTNDPELFNLAMQALKISGAGLTAITGINHATSKNEAVSWDFIKSIWSKLSPMHIKMIQDRIQAYASGKINPYQDLQPTTHP